MSVLDDNVSLGGGYCTIFMETTQEKMWLSSDNFLGEAGRLRRKVLTRLIF